MPNPTVAINVHIPKLDVRIEQAKLSNLQAAFENFCSVAQAAGVPVSASCLVASDVRDDV